MVNTSFRIRTLEHRSNVSLRISQVSSGAGLESSMWAKALLMDIDVYCNVADLPAAASSAAQYSLSRHDFAGCQRLKGGLGMLECIGQISQQITAHDDSSSAMEKRQRLLELMILYVTETASSRWGTFTSLGCWSGYVTRRRREKRVVSLHDCVACSVAPLATRSTIESWHGYGVYEQIPAAQVGKDVLSYGSPLQLHFAIKDFQGGENEVRRTEVLYGCILRRCSSKAEWVSNSYCATLYFWYHGL